MRILPFFDGFLSSHIPLIQKSKKSINLAIKIKTIIFESSQAQQKQTQTNQPNGEPNRRRTDVRSEQRQAVQRYKPTMHLDKYSIRRRANRSDERKRKSGSCHFSEYVPSNLDCAMKVRQTEREQRSSVKPSESYIYRLFPAKTGTHTPQTRIHMEEIP